MELAKKQSSVEFLDGRFSECLSAYVIDFRGVSCNQLSALRNQVKQSGANLSVVKNTLAKRAIEGTKVAGLAPMFKGPTAVIWSTTDPVSPAKALKDFAAVQEKLQIKGGYIDGSVIDAKGVGAMADMPSKEQLYSQLLALINAPATQLVRLVNEPASAVARVIAAQRDKLANG
mgnify:FL=1